MTNSGSSTALPSRPWSRSGAISAHGIDGLLRVRPWEPLLRPGQPPRLHTDAIVIDNFTHLLGCWGLDELADAGDVVFPLGMEELQLFGDRPPVGTDVACRIAILETQRHRIRVEAEIVRPDGTVWMRIRDWEDWRFHWPGRYRDVFRQPRDIFVGEELPLADPPEPRTPWRWPCGWRLPRTWVGPSGAMSSSRPSSGPRSWPHTWPSAAPSAGGRTGSGAVSPPRRPRGGSGRPKAGRRSIRPTWRSSPTNAVAPG